MTLQEIDKLVADIIATTKGDVAAAEMIASKLREHFWRSINRPPRDRKVKHGPSR